MRSPTGEEEESEDIVLKKKVDSIFDRDINTKMERNAKLVLKLANQYPRIKLLEEENSRIIAFGRDLKNYDINSKFEREAAKSVPR